MTLKKIVSGGQTGIDIAAIKAAKEWTNFSWGGFVPKGRLCESGQISDEFFETDRLWSGFTESDSSRYPKRTRQNISSSDATLVLVPKKKLSRGTKLTLTLCRKLKKPYRIFDPYKSYKIPNCAEWICKSNFKVLNVAGPRESKMPGIEERAKIWLMEMFYFVELYQRERIEIWKIIRRSK